VRAAIVSNNAIVLMSGPAGQRDEQ